MLDVVTRAVKTESDTYAKYSVFLESSRSCPDRMPESGVGPNPSRVLRRRNADCPLRCWLYVGRSGDRFRLRHVRGQYLDDRFRRISGVATVGGRKSGNLRLVCAAIRDADSRRLVVRVGNHARAVAWICCAHIRSDAATAGTQPELRDG